MNHYHWLLSRLDAFIRKYYANQLLRGFLILLSAALFFVLTVSVSEYYFYLPVWVRTSLAVLFMSLGAAALIFYIIRPLIKMAKLGKTLSREQAAVIVGRHFPEIEDKLLNILQLGKGNHPSSESRELIEASINQKSSQLSVVPITRAVDLSKNKRYLPFLLPLLLIGLFLFIAAPNIFRESSERLLQPTKEFQKPAPFQFHIQNKELLAVRNSDFTLEVNMEGNALPAEVFVELQGERLPMSQLEKINHRFQYAFRNMTEDVSFRFFAAGFYSQPHTIKVVQKPLLNAVRINISYPPYTGRKNEIRQSLGDLTLPQGTVVGYAIQATHTDEALFVWNGQNAVPLKKQGNAFLAQQRFLQDTSYVLSLRNKQSPVHEDFKYNVQVIPDQFPAIQLEEFKDSITGTHVLLSGIASDDYGIRSIAFQYTVTGPDKKVIQQKSVSLPHSAGVLSPFQYYFDVAPLQLQPGQELNYFVEVWDNDGVNGSKSARSQVMTYRLYNAQELDSALQENAQQISSGLSQSAQQNKQLQQAFQDLQTKMLEGNKSSWESKQDISELLKTQLDVQKKLEDAKKRFEENKKQSERKEYSEDVRQKQEALQKQMDNLLNKELQEQLKKLQELMDKLNQQDAQKKVQDLQQQNKLFNMDMERLQELMKDLEQQMRMEDLANKMDELAKKQGDLKAQTQKQSKDNQSLKKEQQQLKQELDKAMKEDFKEIKENDKQDGKSPDMQKSEELGKEAGEQMQQSGQQLEQNNNSKSQQSQSKAQQNLQQMAQQLRQQAGGMNLQQIELDIKATRQILSNLMRLSFDQENLMTSVRNTPASSPQYLSNQSEQGRLHRNSQMIRDSLFVLSKRVFQLAATVNKETAALENNMKAATSAMEDRAIGVAQTKQQYVMMHTNNLALMLNEILSNLLQMQSQAMQPGSGSCNKPGGMSPKPGAGKQLSDIITGQQQLGNAMQQAQQSRGGKDPGGKEGKDGKEGGKDGKDGKQAGKQGENGSGGGGSGSGSEGDHEYGNSEQLARLANQQAALRRQIQELQSLLNSKGLKGAKELQDIQNQMDRNETDLVNRNLGAQFLQRQRKIMTRMLEVEKSLREQEEDDKRSSRSGEQLARPMPAELKQRMAEQQQLLERYRTAPASLKPYYKNLVDAYYRMIQSR